MAELYVRESQTGEFCNFIYLLEIETVYHSVLGEQGHQVLWLHTTMISEYPCVGLPSSLCRHVDSMINLLVHATQSYLTAELTAV